jgi:polyhydroxyalkanoate synthase subunit PhaC
LAASDDPVLAEIAALQQKLVRTAEALRAAATVHGGCSDRDALYHEGKLTLYRYRPIAPPASVGPLLIVYALVNRPYMMDLQPDRSLIRRLLEQGIDVYLIDWGYPDGADRYVELDDYINGYIDRCVGKVLDAAGAPQLNLLGVCQGGTFSLCYTALHPERVRNLITMVTPVDFHTEDNLLSKWVRDIDVERLVEAYGVVPGDVLNAAYVSMQPFRLLQQKYVNILDSADDQAQIDNFVRMEKWIFDSPAQAGAAFSQFTRWFFQENRLIKGTLAIGGQPVDLKRITQPVLNIFGLQDHLVPPAASQPLEQLIGSSDYTALPLKLGHIGMYVSGRSQTELPQAIAYWLGRRKPATASGPTASGRQAPA